MDALETHTVTFASALRMNPQLPSPANHRSLRRQEETDEPFDLERQESADGLRPFVHVPSFAQDKPPDPADKPAPAADNADELREEAQNPVASDLFRSAVWSNSSIQTGGRKL
jgi:hypothetical protein